MKVAQRHLSFVKSYWHKGLQATESWYMGALLSLYLVIKYFDVAIRTALHNGLWADEVLCISVARLKSASEVIAAIWKGSEYSPPTYDLAMYYFLRLTAAIPPLLADRLPSILAMFCAGILVFLIMRPRVDSICAILSAGLILASTPFLYSFQARPYAFLFLFLSLSLWLWDNIESPRKWLRAFLLWISMSLSVLLHFYGFFYVLTIAFCELLFLLTRHKWRRTVLVPLIATIPTMLSLYPLSKHMSVYLKADIPSQMKFHQFPGYPLFSKTALFLIGGDGFIFSLVYKGALLAVAFSFLNWIVRGKKKDGLSKIKLPPKLADKIANIEIMMISLLLTMVFAFLFTYFVTQSFAPRYLLGISLLPAFFLGYILNKTPEGRIIGLILILLLPSHIKAMGAVHGDDTKIASRQSVLPFLREQVGRSTLPIVIDSPDFIALYYGAEPSLQPRITYLLTPNQGAQPNLPSDLQLKRLTDIFEGIPIYAFDQFIKQHPRFYIISFTSRYEEGSIEQSLEALNMLGPELAHMPTAFLRCAGEAAIKQGCGWP